MAGGIDVALDLEAANGALRARLGVPAHELRVAVKPFAALPLAWSAGLTRPWVPVSGREPGPQSARGVVVSGGSSRNGA